MRSKRIGNQSRYRFGCPDHHIGARRQRIDNALQRRGTRDWAEHRVMVQSRGQGQNRGHRHGTEVIGSPPCERYTGSNEAISQVPSIFVKPTLTLLAANAPSGFS